MRILRKAERLRLYQLFMYRGESVTIIKEPEVFVEHISMEIKGNAKSEPEFIQLYRDDYVEMLSA